MDSVSQVVLGASVSVAWSSHGFYALREQDGQTMIADLRMGEGDKQTFTFGLSTLQRVARLAVRSSQST